MTLSAGTSLGPYEILAPLGAGGMGEVYRAKDTRLDRTVAIKVLPSHLSSDPKRRERFDREARTISSLNHAHICTLYDVGHQDGIDFLVMEYLEGETLNQRLVKGPLPPDQTLRYAIETADALDKAHRQGITHRDLKPANIMLTKSGVKLLDFGLAKLRQTESGSAFANLSMLPTGGGEPLTGEGTILGTFQYMAPEQLEGKDVDARADIFAFGTVVYEMATGKKAFESKSQASLIAAILDSQPTPISSLQPMAPPALDRVVKTCLAKDPDERWQSAHDLGNELKWIAEGSSQPGLVENIGVATVRERTRRTRERLAWATAVLLFVIAAVFAVGYFQRVPKPERAMYFSVGLPLVSIDSGISPDGRLLAFVAYGEKVGRNVLWIHPIGSRTAQWSDTTAGATYPFWSPDSRFIGFFADGKLKKINASGGSAETLCDAPYGRGGAWSQDGIIVFTPDFKTGLFQVSAAGGAPAPVTQVDPSRGETTHRWPFFLPDGRHFFYLAATFSGAHSEVNAIYLGSLDSKERQLIVRADANAAYAPPGYLMYLREGRLVAQPFDAKRFRLSGDPTSIADQVAYLPQVDRAIFSASENGVVAYQSGSATRFSQLTWFSRSGKQLDSLGPPRVYANPRISPDGKRMATDLTDPQAQATNAAIWIYELIHGGATRLTFDPSYDNTPIWSPDGTRIVFSSARRGGNYLYQKLSNGAGADELLLGTGPDRLTLLLPGDWSRDGRFVIYQRPELKTGQDLWILTMTGEKKTFPFVQTKSDEVNGQFSPDGRWVAYASNESGKWQVYVTSFPGAVGKWQISTAGGSQPRWQRDGKELFYLASDNKLMAVQVKPGSTFEAGVATPLFQARPREAISVTDLYSYDVSLDGQRFLINKEVEQMKTPPISVILNWTADLRR